MLTRYFSVAGYNGYNGYNAYNGTTGYTGYRAPVFWGPLKWPNPPANAINSLSQLQRVLW